MTLDPVLALISRSWSVYGVLLSLTNLILTNFEVWTSQIHLRYGFLQNKIAKIPKIPLKSSIGRYWSHNLTVTTNLHWKIWKSSPSPSRLIQQPKNYPSKKTTGKKYWFTKFSLKWFFDGINQHNFSFWKLNFGKTTLKRTQNWWKINWKTFVSPYLWGIC